MSLKLILVEDDLSLGQGLYERLSKEGFQVEWARSVQSGEPLIHGDFDLAIFDLSLPDGSGFDLAQKAKERNRPVIIMTALNSAENRLEAYELGSEEFIPKPFHFRELLLRIQHVLKAHLPPTLPTVLDLPKGSLDLERMCFIDQDGAMTFFAPKDFRVLQLLIDKSPKPVHRDEILDQVWGLDSFPTQRTIDNAVVRIRQILQDPDGEIVRSVRGVGYQWIYSRPEEPS